MESLSSFDRTLCSKGNSEARVSSSWFNLSRWRFEGFDLLCESLLQIFLTLVRKRRIIEVRIWLELIGNLFGFVETYFLLFLRRLLVAYMAVTCEVRLVIFSFFFFLFFLFYCKLIL